MKLMSLLADEESSASIIAACVAADAAISGRLIKRANAADQPRYCETREVLQAVVALGFERTREISLAQATSVYASSAIKSDLWQPCWRHTLACALAASEVARQIGISPAEAYTAALMHDIGRLGLLAAYPAEYEEIVARAEGRSDELIELERERFGMDHTEAGRWLARKWNLPESIVEVILRHHEIPTGALDQVAVAQIACRLADLFGYGVNGPSEARDGNEIMAILPEWVRVRLGGRLGAMQAAIAEEIGHLEASEGLPGGRPEVSVDGGESEEGRLAGESPQDLAGRRPARRWPRTAMVVAILGTIVLLACAAGLFFRT